MAGNEPSAASRFAAEPPRGPEYDDAARRAAAEQREEILAAMLAAADADTPPTDDEILALILGEIAFLQTNRRVPPPERDRVSGR